MCIIKKKYKRYCTCFKDNVISAYLNRNNETAIQISKKFNISKASLFNWINNIKYHYSKIRKTKLTHNILFFIEKYIVNDPYFNMHELQQKIFYLYNITVSISYLYYILHKKLSFSYKKVNPNHIFCDISKHNERIINMRNQLKIININDIFCLDEIHFNTRQYKQYGWTKKGNTLYNKQISPIRLSASVICFISIKGLMQYKIFSKTINQDKFVEFIAENLEIFKNKYIFLDNARIHHSKKIKEFISKHNIHLFFNVPYNPQGNPIENMFSKVKNTFRKNIKYDNTSNNFHSSINNAFLSINKNNIQNCFRHSFQIETI